jgi:hypothetical protein
MDVCVRFSSPPINMIVAAANPGLCDLKEDGYSYRWSIFNKIIQGIWILWTDVKHSEGK